MYALYVFTYSEIPSDRDAYPLKDVSKFPIHYLWLLWSFRWIDGDGDIPREFNDLGSLMSRAITDPTSNYRPKDAILSVEQFIASSRVIGEAELRVFFYGLACCDPSIIDDPAGLLFLASLTLKLCQQSNVSTLKIFTLFIQARYFNNHVRLLHILPLIRSLSLKSAPLEDNTAVGELDTNLTKEISLELDALIEAVCSRFYSYIDKEANYGVVSLLSLVATLDQSHLAAKQIICQLQKKNHVWRRAFRYFDEHRESAYLHSLPDMFTSEPAADSPIRQQQVHLIPQLNKQLHKLDSTFQLPEGPYTFDHELRAKEIMQAAYAEYIKSSGVIPEPQPGIPMSSAIPLPCTTGSGSVQDESGLGGAEVDLRDAVIDITLPVDTEKPNDEDVDDSEVVVGTDWRDNLYM
jgi:hypothetical protein